MRNARRLVGRRASLVVARWLFSPRRWVGSWVEKRERNEREKRESEIESEREGAVYRASKRQRKRLQPRARPRGGFLRAKSPYSASLGRGPHAGGRGVLGLRRPFASLGLFPLRSNRALQNASQLPLSPAPRGNASEAPKSRLNCALPLGAGALGRASAFLQRLPLGLPTPPSRARCIECASTVPCLSSRSAGRSPFKVCSSAVDVCFAFPTDFPRGRGRRGRRSRPKPSAALFA